MKIYIQGMALSKNKIEEKLYNFSDKVEEHITKCAMYGDSLGNGKYDHWISELSNWISVANDMTCKTNKKKLRPIQYENSLFASIGTDEADARLNLYNLQIHNEKSSNSYPYKEVDDAMVDRMQKCSINMISEFCELLATSNTLSRLDIINRIHDVLDPICKEVQT